MIVKRDNFLYTIFVSLMKFVYILLRDKLNSTKSKRIFEEKIPDVTEIPLRFKFFLQLLDTDTLKINNNRK